MHQMGLSHLHRTCTELARAVITKHSTFATFLSEPLDGLQRWQSAHTLVGLPILGAVHGALTTPCSSCPALLLRQCL
jgi:hypothetical protein